MIQILLVLLLCSIIIIIILWTTLNKRNKVLEKTVFAKHELEVLRKDEMKKYFKEEWEQEEKSLKDKLKVKTDGLETEWKLKFQQHQSQLNVLDNEIKSYQSILKEKEKRYNEVNQDLEVYRQGKIQEIDTGAQEYEQRKRQAIDHAMEEHKLSLQQQSGQLQKELKEQEDKLKLEIEGIQSELEEERSKRAAINEEILRQRKLEQEQDFFRIQLDPDDTDDIEILRSVTTRLRHPEAINKVIWTGYYQKPLAELRKRILTNGDVSGVYKITRLKTNEIYIGQTTSVDKRWQEHVKSALGVGTLASSQLHRVMKSDGPENFTFELLEEVPKDKLRERESYYIDFYDSKTYGLNSVTGDKNK